MNYTKYGRRLVFSLDEQHMEKLRLFQEKQKKSKAAVIRMAIEKL